MVRFALTLALAVSLCAQTKQERGKRAVDDALAALGGEKYLAMRDRVETGRAYSFYREQLSGLSLATIYTRYLTRPADPRPGIPYVRERQSFGKEERSGAVLFAEGKGYEITFRGARPMAQERIDRYLDSTLHNVLYILRQRLGEPGLIFESQGSDTMDNQPVEIVNIIDAENRTVTVYFSRSTKLPIRQVYYWRDPKTRDRNEEVTIFGKFHDVGDGVQWPYDIQRLRNGEKVYQIYSDRVEINRGLTDELFTLPANMKVLPPAR
jgi:hypothetical protein